MIESNSAADYLDALFSFEQAAERLASVNPIMLSSQEVLEGLRRLERAARKVPRAPRELVSHSIAPDGADTVS